MPIKIHSFLIIYLLFRNPTPENKIAIPDANNTESKPLTSHSVTK